MSTLITTVGSIVTAAAGWVSTFVGTITASGNEILQLFILLPLVGLGIGLLKRLIKV